MDLMNDNQLNDILGVSLEEMFQKKLELVNSDKQKAPSAGTTQAEILANVMKNRYYKIMPSSDKFAAAAISTTIQKYGPLDIDTADLIAFVAWENSTSVWECVKKAIITSVMCNDDVDAECACEAGMIFAASINQSAKSSAGASYAKTMMGFQRLLGMPIEVVPNDKISGNPDAVSPNLKFYLANKANKRSSVVIEYKTSSKDRGAQFEKGSDGDTRIFITADFKPNKNVANLLTSRDIIIVVPEILKSRIPFYANNSKVIT